MLGLLVAAGLSALAACGSEGTAPDGHDAGVDGAGGGDAAAADATDGASPACKTGLPGVATDAVACGAATCANASEPVCCIGGATRCAASCPNLELAWACDNSAQCGAGKICCFEPPLLDVKTCPGTAAALAPICQTDRDCQHVACLTDADCAGATCYAVVVNTGPGNDRRTIGVCR